MIKTYLIQASVSGAYKQDSRPFPHQELDIHSNSTLCTPPHAPLNCCSLNCQIQMIQEETATVTALLWERGGLNVISKFYYQQYHWSCLVMRPQLVASQKGSQYQVTEISFFLSEKKKKKQKKSCIKGFSSLFLLPYPYSTHPSLSKGLTGYLIQHAYLKYPGIKIIICFCGEKRNRYTDKCVYMYN